MSTENNKEIKQEDDIKYCVCAMVDLLGFSSHLEISGYDLRTNIGEHAVKRLANLEAILQMITTEKESRTDYYPKDYHVQRINDAVFFTMDLDDKLKPAVGATIIQGMPGGSQTEFLESFEQYKSATISSLQTILDPLLKFIGLISRVHISLNKMEGEAFFPGAKTVISTGFRRKFKDDYFSANFALSNAYQAEKSLHGPSLYLDDGILYLMSFNKYALNLSKFAHFQFKKASFDCFNVNDNLYNMVEEFTIPKPIEIKLFRKEYQFRELNPSPLTYLQNLPSMMVYLSGSKSPELSNLFFKHIFNAIKIGITREKVEIPKPPPSFIYNGSNDLDVDIGILGEFLSTGKSETREKFQKEKEEREFNEKYGHLNEDGKMKIRELLNEEVDIDLEEIDVADCRKDIFRMSEQTFNSLMFMFKGDFNQLDYLVEN